MMIHFELSRENTAHFVKKEPVKVLRAIELVIYVLIIIIKKLIGILTEKSL